MGSRKFIGISSLACCEMWVKMSYLAHIQRWREQGYSDSLIPENVIRRRFAAGLQNLERAYKLAVDAWAKYDNVGESPILLEWGENQ